MYSSVLSYSILFVLLLTLGSWGEKAHRKINSSCVEYFPKELQQLKNWAPILADHSSDADFRKKDDKNEFVRHFIDIDNYADFANTHIISEDFKIACTQYGKINVIKNGTLPWVTDSTYKALVKDLKSENWEQAVLTAADLGHYVGDGFMPLHLTANYDGQMTDQTGFHRRFEVTMTDNYIDEISFKTSGIKTVTNIKSFIFRYIYNNYYNIGTLLQADSRAYEKAGKQYNEIYYESLWNETRLLTNQLLHESSKSLASLIYSAWLDAGKPKIPDFKGEISR